MLKIRISSTIDAILGRRNDSENELDPVGYNKAKKETKGFAMAPAMIQMLTTARRR
jgi:hypothetical protein